jgi:hypothetical protein
MGPERLRHGGILQAQFGYTLMASGAPIHNIHFRNPDLADFEAEIRQQALGVRPSLGEADVVPFVSLPRPQMLAYGRNCQHRQEDHA